MHSHAIGTLLLAAVTDYGRAEDREATHRAGFDAYLVKPVDLGKLEKLLAGARDGAQPGE